MPKVGDRVIVEGNKIGSPRREGTLIGTAGPLINVRWDDGTVSMFTPGAGSVAFESGRGKTAGDGHAKKTAVAKKTVKSKPAVKTAKKKR